MIRPRNFRPNSTQAFSLIEVVLAIGITSFALLATVGLLPIGLNTLSESNTQTAVANISHQIRGELQQISFDPKADFNVQKLSATTYYFTREGAKSDSSGAYYRATFDINNGAVGGSAFDNSVAQNIKVTLSYPFGAPVTQTKTAVFSLFAARQFDK